MDYVCLRAGVCKLREFMSVDLSYEPSIILRLISVHYNQTFVAGVGIIICLQNNKN